jgi:hypothetical protein
MNESDFRRTARAWLDEGPTRMDDRGVQDVLDRIHVIPQRRAWWPAQRFPAMTNLFRIAAGVTAIAALIVALVALNPQPSGPGAEEPTPSPTPSGPLPTIPIGETSFSLAAGTYRAADPFPKRVTVTLPDGWDGNVGGPYAIWLSRNAPNAEVDLQIFDKVYADPCDIGKGLLNPLPGSSVDDLVTALTNLPGGMTVTDPVDVTISGYHGKQVTITAPISADRCTLEPGAGFRLWELPLGATMDLAVGDSFQVSVLDVGGQRIVLVVAGVQPGKTTLTPEVQDVVDSIRIEPGP